MPDASPMAYELVVERAFRAAIANARLYVQGVIRGLNTEGKVITRDAQNILAIDNASRALFVTLQGLGIDEAIQTEAQALNDMAHGILVEYEGNLDPRYSEESLASIQMLAEGADQQITMAMGTMSEGVAALLRASVLGGTDVLQLLGDVETRLLVGEANLLTIAITTLHSFSTSVTIAHSKEAGVEWFGYIGPQDDITREWCQHWVRRRGTLAMFEASAGQWGHASQPGPVESYRGGYNCRHDLIPLFAEDLKDWPEGPLP
jgi:hypothetical protein